MADLRFIEAVFVPPATNTSNAELEPELADGQFDIGDVLILDELKDLGDDEYWSYLYVQCGPGGSDDAWETLAHTDLVARSIRLLKRGIYQMTRSKQRHREVMSRPDYQAWCRERNAILENMHARRDWLAVQAREATELLSRRETKAIRAEQEAHAAELHASRRLQEKLVAAIYYHRRESEEAGRQPIDADLKLWRVLARRPLGLGGKSLDELWGAGRLDALIDGADGEAGDRR